jgi:membrane protein implicated in regulation of membrane protease activity
VLLGKISFVLGMANAKGEYVITLGGTRWLIANPQQIPAGERVRVVRQEGEWIEVRIPLL